MTKSNYENLLKRIEDKLGDSNEESSNRFELPIVDVMWEGQKTFLRNFSEFPKVLRRDPDKVLQYLSKEFAVPAERLGDKQCLSVVGLLMTSHDYFKFMLKTTLNVQHVKALIQKF